MTIVRDRPAAASRGQRDTLAGVTLMTGSATSNQLRAATAALAFPVLGPLGVVAIRQWVAAAVLLTATRPKFSAFTARQWQPVLALALIFAVMNLSLYLAIDGIGLGLAERFAAEGMRVVMADVEEPALATAVMMAGQSGGAVRLINVMPLTPVMLAEYVPADFEAQQRKSAEEALTIVAKETGLDPDCVSAAVRSSACCSFWSWSR